ncbi:Transcription elongation factor, GreA/GreB family [Flavobacteriaceae bacterium MAR_2010_188]|nr:Transcription elongation factor, GreA/GreB family [Flavobacteriaceae bacterium MAR_2010_188]
MENESIKLKILTLCKQSVQDKSEALQQQSKSLQNSLSSETKSSAGDKHETGRAMIQLEREQLGRQLAQLEQQSEILSRINPDQPHKLISVGSLIFTSKENYFISVAIGKLEVEGQTFYAISNNSPTGKLLLMKSAGDTVEFNKTVFSIESVI